MLGEILGGGAGALLGGVLGGAKKKAGPDAGNVFSTDQETKDKMSRNLKNFLDYKGSAAAIDPIQSSRIASQEVMNNPLLAGMYGESGALGRALGEEQDLSSRGYSLQPEDYEAYGQGSGQIARNFGQAETGLAEALSARGLSNSGVANQAFMTSQGNKLEQLAGLQRKISDDRMKMNLQRLQQTRQFVQGMGGMAQEAQQQQFGRQQAAEEMGFGQKERIVGAGEKRLSNEQNQANTQLAQKMQYAQDPSWAKVLGGATSGAMSGARFGGALS